ncbi:MAG: hypothetical protein KAS23_11800 [Anaerohalosphaera sp.]|nr:hypothetical protein [Anaerohalosphaera sp.]
MLYYIKITILIIAGPLFLIAAAAHIVVKIKMRPKADSDLDDCCCEFEHLNHDVARYEKFSRITYITAIIAIILLFLSIAV